MKYLGLVTAIYAGSIVTSPAHDALIGTPWVHAEASIGQPVAWQDTDEAFKANAVVDSASSVAGHYVHSEHGVVFNSTETAFQMF